MSTKSIPTHSKSTSFAIRPGTPADSYAVFTVFEESLADLSRRLGTSKPTSASNSEALARMWQERRSLYEHLADTAEQFWLAERNGRVIGFARSLQSDGLRQLTEFFVLPTEQSSGVGKELFNRAFPKEGPEHRSIIATTDFRAQGLYLKAGVYPRFPIYYFGRTPEIVTPDTDLTFKPLTATAENLETIGQIDREVTGHRRDATHTWLCSNRQGYLYYRGERPVGYGYVGARNGPFALLTPTDFPAVLAHAESEAAKNNHEFGIEVPMINQTVVDYLLGRGYKLDTFMAIFMSNVPFGKFENYVISSPPFFM